MQLHISDTIVWKLVHPMNFAPFLTRPVFLFFFHFFLGWVGDTCCAMRFGLQNEPRFAISHVLLPISYFVFANEYKK